MITCKSIIEEVCIIIEFSNQRKIIHGVNSQNTRCYLMTKAFSNDNIFSQHVDEYIYIFNNSTFKVK